MQTTMIEQEILATVQGLPLETQQEILKFSLVLKSKLQEKKANATAKINIPTFYGDGLKNGVDLNNSRQLQDIFDEDGIA